MAWNHLSLCWWIWFACSVLPLAKSAVSFVSTFSHHNAFTVDINLLQLMVTVEGNQGLLPCSFVCLTWATVLNDRGKLQHTRLAALNVFDFIYTHRVKKRTAEAAPSLSPVQDFLFLVPSCQPSQPKHLKLFTFIQNFYFTSIYNHYSGSI